MKKLTLLVVIAALFSGCSEKNNGAVYGTMTSSEIYLAAEVSGRIKQFTKDEGEIVQAGELLAVIDTTDVQLRLDELNKTIELKNLAMKTRETEIAVFEQEKANLEIDRRRFELLAEAEAIAEKNLDDINAKLKVLELRLKQANQSLAVSRKEIELAEVKRAQVIARKEKYFVYAEEKGTILEKYLKKGEITMPGKSLGKIADLTTMTAKLYVSETYLSYLQIGEEVEIFIDIKNDELKKYSGKITSIASEAEFTPKVIQTRQERVNLVYEIEVECLNDGGLKIGMPVEMVFEE